LKRHSSLYLVSLLIALMVACNLPSAQLSDKSDITQTIDSPTRETVAALTDSTEKPPAVSTDTISINEKTPIAAVTITPSKTTPPDQKATITSSEDTNCRKGPGVIYEIVGQLQVGQTSEVVAKYQNGKFWLIKNPSNPAQECWVWDETTQVNGDIAALPEATPPATPDVTLNLTIYAVISPITYSGACPVTVELIGNHTVNTPTIVSYQWYIGDLLVSSGAVTAGASGTFTSSDQITITSTTTDPIRLKASAGVKSVTTSPIAFSIVCN
jgi:hypothetical protein